jgi:hypothetical protein
VRLVPNVIVDPIHTLEGPDGVIVGVGKAFPVTVVVAVCVKAGHPKLDTVTPYVFVPTTAVNVVVEAVPLAPVPVHAYV